MPQKLTTSIQYGFDFVFLWYLHTSYHHHSWFVHIYYCTITIAYVCLVWLGRNGQSELYGTIFLHHHFDARNSCQFSGNFFPIKTHKKGDKNRLEYQKITYPNGLLSMCRSLSYYYIDIGILFMLSIAYYYEFQILWSIPVFHLRKKNERKKKKENVARVCLIGMAIYVCFVCLSIFLLIFICFKKNLSLECNCQLVVTVSV